MELAAANPVLVASEGVVCEAGTSQVFLEFSDIPYAEQSVKW